MLSGTQKSLKDSFREFKEKNRNLRNSSYESNHRNSAVDYEESSSDDYFNIDKKLRQRENQKRLNKQMEEHIQPMERKRSARQKSKNSSSKDKVQNNVSQKIDDYYSEIDQLAFKIDQIYKINAEMNNQKGLDRVLKVQELLKGFKKKVIKDNQQTYPVYQNQDKKQNNISSQVLQEFEKQLKEQSELNIDLQNQLQLKDRELQEKENRVQQIQMNQDIVEMLKRNQEYLEKQVVIQQKQLEEEKSRNNAQQMIFQTELKQMECIFEKLRQQYETRMKTQTDNSVI